MSEPTQAVERLVISRQIRHGGNPVLSYQMACAKVSIGPTGNYRLDKGVSTGKIDGVVATVMAIDRATAGKTTSVYEERGLLVIGDE